MKSLLKTLIIISLMQFSSLSLAIDNYISDYEPDYFIGKLKKEKSVCWTAPDKKDYCFSKTSEGLTIVPYEDKP
ncbi:hypothetical protein [Arsenophonus nasoniae]|uniref:Uncharacterized protein n=1 Tax=Arsenophonus nasoniae TaxID=638 RepID=A0AA95GJN4_9GAMM|nr:hypothetical protein [Arsenophonus nasoniae]WGM00177.1 hypothetical protein QE210_09740 [Arsenophonus nasoniae]